MSFIKRMKDESGGVTILVAVSMTVILGITALVADLGVAYIDTSNVQTAADATAYSVGTMLPIRTDDTQKIEDAKRVAVEYCARNGETLNPEDIEFLQERNGYYHSIRVSVHSTNETNFAKIFGINQVSVTRSAAIETVPASSIYGAVPIGVEKSSFDTMKQQGQTQHITLKYGGGDGENGVFGWVVLDGENASNAQILYWMMYGYNGYSTIGSEYPAATGNKASAAKKGLEYRKSLCTHYSSQGGCSVDHYNIDCPLIVKALVYEYVDARTIRVVGFAPFLLESVDNQANITGSYLEIQLSSEANLDAADCGLYSIRLCD